MVSSTIGLLPNQDRHVSSSSARGSADGVLVERCTCSYGSSYIDKSKTKIVFSCFLSAEQRTILLRSIVAECRGVITHFLFSQFAFGVMKQTKADMAYRSRAHRHPAHPPPPARAPPRPGERGVTAWDGNRTSVFLHSMSMSMSCTMCKNAERNESRPAPKSVSDLPR